ncbi:hypothetical protein [Bacillus sp. T33-2]|uniref:hypothetical protein n=1 Tax=Bacillus sp. T33-2 TaxID=2054168 RepID=UPI000C7765F0|nr:hypothetical protein [Bacillus sp. T33-2]PLR98845.1 hypothetical protein CVD19_04215 [Bacillus sp. T33-2]
MSIQQYYRQTAVTFLNACTAAVIILAVILAVSLFLPEKPPLFLLLIPFLAFSFIHFHGYLLYSNRFKESIIDVGTDSKELLANNDLLLAFAPAPALRLLLFEPGGLLVGEVKEAQPIGLRWILPYFIDKLIPKTFGLYDKDGNLVTELKINGSTVNVLDMKKRTICRYRQMRASAQGDNGIALLGEGVELSRCDQSSLYTDIHFTKQNGKTAARLQKGWMPVEWGKKFKDANMPVLTFDPNISMQEKLAVIGAIAVHYMYSNH